MRQIVFIAHNLRSTHNVGSLLRTADGLGVTKVYLTGYTPYPKSTSDNRLPHIANKVHKQITKTALGAEQNGNVEHVQHIEDVIANLKEHGFDIIAIEQASSSVDIAQFKPSGKLALIVGREVEGLEPEVLKKCDQTVEIPMLGNKESLNVVQAAAIVMYHARYFPFA